MQNTTSLGRLAKLLFLASLFATLSSAYGAFPFYEPFADATASGGTSYTVGTTLKANVNATGDVWFGTGTTTSGAKALISGSNLFYAGLAASSGNSYQTGAANGEGGRMFVTSQTSGNVHGITNQNVTVYYSLLVQLTDLTALSTTGDHWIGFNNQGTVNNQTSQPTIQGARLYFRKVDATDYNVGIAKSTTNAVWDTTPRSTSDVLFIVVGYQMNAAGGIGTDDNVYLWVNPDASTFAQSAAPTTNTVQVIGTDADMTMLSSFVILNRSTTCATAATIDEVRVGKTWMFVTGGPEFVNPPAAATNISSQSTLILDGTAKSGSGTALSYKWQKDGVNLADSANISGSTTAILTVSSVTTDDGGVYSVIVNDAVGTITNSTRANVDRPPYIVWHGGDVANPTTWNHSISNWFNPVTTGSDTFHDADSVVFDDSAVTNSVNVVGTNVFTGMFTSNNVGALTLTGTGDLNGPLDVEGTSSVTLALANMPSLTAITNNAGQLVFALGAVTNVFTGPISDNGAGQGTLVQNGANTLILAGNNSSFNGKLIAQSGALKLGSAKSLGSTTASVVVSNGATLDIGGFNFSNNAVAVQGTGFGGTNGAINNSGGTLQQQALSKVTLTGDTTFSATTSRWDIGTNNVAGGYFNGNGFTLTKIGTQPVIIKDEGETGLGDIHIVSARLGFQGNITMGDPNKTVTIESGGILTLFSVLNGVTKNLVLNSGLLDSGGAANTFNGPITLNGDCTFGVRSQLDLGGNISGTGSLIATINDTVGNGSTGTALHLHGVNTYTGATFVRTNTGLVLDAQSLPASSIFEVDTGASLNATAVATWTLGNGQSITGAGTVGANSVTFGSGSTLAPGSSNALGTLTFNANPTFQTGSTNLFKLVPGGSSDQVTGLGAVTFGGTLVLSNFAGTAFSAGNSYTLFNATSYQGSFDTIVPATPGNGLVWNTNNLAINGTISVAAQAQAHFTGGSKLGDGNFQLTFSGPVGQPYTLLGTTNIALPLTNWTVVTSGTVDSDPFSVSDLTATNFPTRFYSLKVGQ